MEDVIIKLAEIEAAASSIMDSVAVQKKKMLEEHDAKIKSFDDEVDQNTAKKIQKIRQDLDVSEQKELAAQEQAVTKLIQKMESYYSHSQEEMAQKLYDKILRM